MFNMLKRHRIITSLQNKMLDGIVQLKVLIFLQCIYVKFYLLFKCRLIIACINVMQFVVALEKRSFEI